MSYYFNDKPPNKKLSKKKVWIFVNVQKMIWTIMVTFLFAWWPPVTILDWIMAGVLINFWTGVILVDKRPGFWKQFED